MKVSTLVILFCSSLLSLSCAKKESIAEKPNFAAWKASTLSERKIGNEVIPTEKVLACRKTESLPENVQYYYTVVANPETKKETVDENNAKITSYSQAELQIEYYAISADGADTLVKILFSANVDIQFIQLDNGMGDVLAKVTVSTETLETIQAKYKSNPYFKYLKEGDEILTLNDKKGSFNSKKSNVTKMELPGLMQGDSVECH